MIPFAQIQMAETASGIQQRTILETRVILIGVYQCEEIYWQAITMDTYGLKRLGPYWLKV